MAESNNPIILIQTDTAFVAAAGMTPEGVNSSIVDAATGSLKDVAQLVKNSCGQLIQELRGMEGGPKELAFEFGVSLSAEGSVPFITKGSIGANFKVSVKWTL